MLPGLTGRGVRGFEAQHDPTGGSCRDDLRVIAHHGPVRRWLGFQPRARSTAARNRC